MRALLGLLVVLGVLAQPSFAVACKCREVDLRELSERYTVFVGTAVEYLERKDSGGEPGHQGPRVNAATRFEVQYSRDVPVGASVIVAMDIYTSCSTFFSVGERHLVTAFELGELLSVNECPRLQDEIENELLAELRVPEGFLEPSRTRDGEPSRCRHPSTLDEAFEAADVVGFWDAKASCVVPGGDAVEHAAVMRWGWKGLRQGELFRVRVAGHYEEPAPPSFHFELVDATETGWPPAGFLRREGDSFVNDGCLLPLAPASFDEATEAVRRLFPFPEDYPRRHFPESGPPWPMPTCMTLDDSYFVGADAALARYVQGFEGRRKSHGVVRSAKAASPRTTAVPPCDGSCAACAVSPPTQRVPFVWLAVALAALARRVRTGATSARSRASSRRPTRCACRARFRARSRSSTRSRP